MIHIFYLAGGNSARFGDANKLLIDFFGKPLFCYGLDVLMDAASKRDDCVISVVSRYDEILKYAEDNGLSAVFSEDSEQGASYSIRDGLAAAGNIAATDFMFFMVADQPFLRVATINELLYALTVDTEILSLCHEQRPGNPKIFSGKLLPEFHKLCGDEGGKKILSNHRVQRLQVASTLELLDIDRQDYLRHITNVFVTGGKSTGKSTLVNKLMKKLAISFGGYVTQPDAEYPEGSTYVMQDIATGEIQSISRYDKRIFKGIDSTFEGFGVRCVQEALDSINDCIVFDEIGRFERNCPLFLNALLQSFNSTKTVIGILKKEDLPHIYEYRCREDSVVLDLDAMTMLEAEQHLTFLLRNIY